MWPDDDVMMPIYTAQSKKHFFCRDAVCAFVLQQNCLPLNPFRVFDFFLGDRVDRQLVRRGNRNLIRVSAQLWAFGPVADGVLKEIYFAMQEGKRVRFFTIGSKPRSIREVLDAREVKFEPEIHASRTTRQELIARLASGGCFGQGILFPEDRGGLADEVLSKLSGEDDDAGDE